MSRKIIGVTVGSPLPKPNLMQNDPTKGDYVKGKEEFLKQIGVSGSGGSVSTVTEQIVYDTDFSIDGFCRPAPKSGELFGTNTGYARTDYIDISTYTTLTIHVRPRTDSVSPCVWFDANKNYISGEVAEVLTESDYTYNVPSGAVYAIFSSEKTVTQDRTVHGTRSVIIPNGGSVSTAQMKCYISPSGSDDNDGKTTETPVLTLKQASKICSEDGEVVFLEGDYYNLDFDLSAFAKVSAIGNVRLIYPAEKFTDASLVSGYTRVYSVPYTGSYSDYLWQMDVPDANTAISAEERHPLQRNRTHRLEHTRLYPVTTFDMNDDGLTGYLTTMEATTDYWMYCTDGTNLYFTVPNADFAAHPVIIPGKTTLKASEKKNVYISGLKIYFASILTTNLSGVLDDLTVGYHNASGAIRWDNTFGLTLNNCEAVASTNDGINGHDSGDVTCYNCWGHDNSDDGESDHETCHIIQYGGLYEYNGNGCTPASGASGEYINTICRNNGAWDWVSDPAGTGFSAQNTSTTDPALMYCIGCHSSGNKIGFRQKTTSKATFINCVSKNDETAYGSGTQINCKDESHQDAQNVSWNDIEDKPFEDGEETVKYDNPDAQFDDFGEYWETLEQDILTPGKDYKVELNGDTYYATCFTPFDNIDRLEVGNDIYISVERLADGDVEMLISAGTEFEYATSSIKITEVEKVKTLDSKYLPYKTEDWTFELDDGSTVTKDVVVQ